MIDFFNAFHFLRPFWLLGIAPALLICWYFFRHRKGNTGFEHWIDSNLLNHISTGKQQKNKPTPYIGLALLWIISLIALAGPVWERLPQALYDNENAMVIILDLSPSMLAQDNKPSRLVRARLKIQDLLQQRKDGLTALIAYSGEAHIVTPLTQDTKTIANLLPTLEPSLLPIPGSNTEMAIHLAKQLLNESGLQAGTLVLVTDGVDTSANKTIRSLLDNKLSLIILGLGTASGAPIPNEGDFLRDGNNEIISVSRNDQQLQNLADETNGFYLPLQADDKDIIWISRAANLYQAADNQDAQESDQWYEFGPTLILLFLPLFALFFRRGWLLSFLLIGFLPSLSPTPTYADTDNQNGLQQFWKSLWQTPDQQGQVLFDQQQYDQATKTFKDYQWKGSAAYRNQDYESAAQYFSQGDSADDHYNRGNALAKAGQIESAISAYNTALEKKSDHHDAQKNKSLLEELLQSQQNEGDNKHSDQSKNHQEENQDEKQEQQQQKDQRENNSNNNQSSQNNEDLQQNQENSSTEEQSPETEQENLNNQDSPEQSLQSINEQDSSTLSQEQQQALEQWLNKVPDNPGGLLRRKFDYEYRKRLKEYQSGEWELPENDAHKRY